MATEEQTIEKPQKLPQTSILTKKRYEEIVRLLSEAIDNTERLEHVKSEFRKIMAFDPNVKKYTPELGKQIMASRVRRAAALGISVQDYKSGRWKKKEEYAAAPPTHVQT